MRALKKRLVRLITAGNLAVVLYDIPTGLLNLAWELFVVRLTLEQWGIIHPIYWFFKYGFGFISAAITKTFRRWFRVQDDKHSWRRKVADILGLSLYRIPLFVVIAFLAGRPWSQVKLCLIFSIAEHIVFGPFYGMILDFCERRIVKNGQMQANTQPEEFELAASDAQ